MKKYRVGATLRKVSLILGIMMVSPGGGANIGISIPIQDLSDRIVQSQTISQEILDLNIFKMALNPEDKMETSNVIDVKVDWVSYHYGHWVWMDPWGWAWDEDAPWGLFSNPSIASEEVLQPTVAIVELSGMLPTSSAISDVKNDVQASVTAALRAANVFSQIKKSRPLKTLEPSEDTSINIQAYHPPQNPIVIESPKPKVAQRVFPKLENVIEQISILPNIDKSE